MIYPESELLALLSLYLLKDDVIFVGQILKISIGKSHGILLTKVRQNDKI